jgi:hypothetical protein
MKENAKIKMYPGEITLRYLRGQEMQNCGGPFDFAQGRLLGRIFIYSRLKMSFIDHEKNGSLPPA